MQFGTIKFNGKEVNVLVSFEENDWGKNLVLHFPEGTDTRNWYHGVMIKTDLPKEQEEQ